MAIGTAFGSENFGEWIEALRTALRKQDAPR